MAAAGSRPGYDVVSLSASVPSLAVSIRAFTARRASHRRNHAMESEHEFDDRLTLKGDARRTFLLGAAGGMATLAAGGIIAAGKQASAAEPTGAAAPLLAYVGCF